jgi:cytoskeleton protein RodZ
MEIQAGSLLPRMSSTVGQQLRQAREERSLTIEEAAQTTRIRVHYLTAMEAGEFDKLPSAVQVRGFLRAYADFLSLDGDALLAALDGEQNSAASLPSTRASKQAEKKPASNPEQTAQIFTGIGRSLQRQRELLGLSLDDVERHTHLRQHYLKALEAGKLDELPSPVQGRGMLNNYASFLGLDPEPLLLHFAEGLQIRLAARQAAQPEAHPAQPKRKSRLPAPLRRFFSGDTLIGGALAVFLVVFLIWGAIRIFAITSNQESTPTAPSIADVLLASPTATGTFTPEPPTPTIPLPQQLFPTQALATDAETGNLLPVTPQTGLQLYITIQQRAWMRVTVDGKVEFDGRVIPGSAYPFVGESQVEVLTGNGAALEIFFNGVDLGTMGAFGQVVNRIYAQEGILMPTPSITPTPSATLPETPAPPPTATPSSGEGTSPALP